MSGPAASVQLVEGNSLAVMAWVVGMDNMPITQSSIPGTGGITREILDMTNQTVIATNTLDVLDVIYNTPQTGKGWPAIYTTGFNWRNVVSGSNWDGLTEDIEVQIKYTFEDIDGNPIVWVSKPFQVNATIATP